MREDLGEPRTMATSNRNQSLVESHGTLTAQIDG